MTHVASRSQRPPVAHLFRRCLSVGVVLALTCVLSASATAQTPVKISWCLGTYIENGITKEYTYRDAHITIDIDRSPPSVIVPPTTVDGGFPPPTVGPIQMSSAAHTYTIDWAISPPTPPLKGKRTLGVEFVVPGPSRLKPGEVTIRSATLTGVSAQLDSGSIPFPSLDVPLPTITIEKKQDALVHVDFVIDVSLRETQISHMELYRTSPDDAPGLHLLNPVLFPLVPKTPLPAPADFKLPPGMHVNFSVAGIEDREWLLGYYQAEWVDPDMSAAAGTPVITVIESWFAYQVIVPEPSTVSSLLAAGAVLALVRRRQLPSNLEFPCS